jgi:hypothetical protein
MSRKQLCPVPRESDAKPVHGSGTLGLLEMHRLLLSDCQEYYRRKLEQFDEVTFINLFGNKVVLFLTSAGAQAVAMRVAPRGGRHCSWRFRLKSLERCRVGRNDLPVSK